jgi:triosephosphate isomerase (TIM)
MRRPFIAGNWKMNLDRAKAVALAKAVAEQSAAVAGVEVAVCPPSLYLEAVGKAIEGSTVGLGAQNMYSQAEGAFTGEISPAMLKDLGCKYVILGHSERRAIFKETDAEINDKVYAALEAGLIPVVCVGETLAEREADRTMRVVRRQFDGSLSGLSADEISKVVIAYEPVWAIGTGKTATNEQAEQVHLDLRKVIEDRYNREVAGAIRIQYGGSVKPANAAGLMSQPNIDGALVGGAALKADQFMPIVTAVPQARRVP